MESANSTPLAVSRGRIEIEVPADPIVVTFAKRAAPAASQQAGDEPAAERGAPGVLERDAGPVAAGAPTTPTGGSAPRRTRLVVRWCGRGPVSAVVGVRSGGRFKVFAKAGVVRRRRCSLVVRIAGVGRLRQRAGNAALAVRLTRAKRARVVLVR